MVTLAGVIIVAALYWEGWFGLDFWLVIAATINGALGTVRAIFDPDWYWRFRYKEGAEPDYPLIILADKHRKAMVRLCITKGILFSLMAILAWHLGTKAGYFSN
jgi:hypothetical protein